MPYLDSSTAILFQSLHNFFGNHSDLEGILAELGDPERFLSLWKDQPRLDAMWAETHRFTHNWLAAAFSLVDHCRRLTSDNRLLHEVVRTEYVSRIKDEFDEDPLHRFVQGLRVYTLHYRIPLTSMQMGGSVTNGTLQNDFRCGIVLQVAPLLEWSEWHQHALTFLDQQKEDLFLQDFVGEYSAKIRVFYSWLLERNREVSLGRRCHE